MLKVKTKFVDYGNAKAVLIPADIRKDSAFKFDETEDLEIEIKEDFLIIKKLPRSAKQNKAGEK